SQLPVSMRAVGYQTLTSGESETMKRLRKRIETMERSTMSIRRAHQAIAHRALEQLSLAHLDLLISGFGADREGRSLTELESAAREAYVSALQRQYHQ